MRVLFVTTRGAKVGPLDMSAVPRVGESVNIEDHFYGKVAAVDWKIYALDWPKPSIDVMVTIKEP